jgi:septal ring factor EnvC (AmiA/AmiB activator)
MQPDLLSPEKEENQPASSSPQENTPPILLSSNDGQIEIPPAEEATNINPPPAGRKRSKFNLAYLALGVLVFLLLAAFAWVGYWSYDLSAELITTQQQLAALQADHAQLQTDYATLKSENEKLNTELTQARADLEKTNTDLAAVQSDHAKSQDQNKTLKAKIDKASKMAEILSAFTAIQSENDFLKLDKLIRDSRNQDLLAEWNNISNEEDFRNFLNYLVLAIRDSLN